MLIFTAEIFSLRSLVLAGALIMIGGLVGWHWPDRVATTERELAFEREHNIVVHPNGSPTVNRWAMRLLILLMAIALGVFLFCYFYIRLENPVWPPANIPLPNWPVAAISSVLLLLGVGAMRWANQAIEADNQRRLRMGLLLAFGLGAAAFGLLFYDFTRLPFNQSIHAYASLFYTLSGFLFVITLGALGQNLFTQFWAWRGHYSAREHVAVAIGALYWDALLVLWLITAGTLYGAPYLI